MDAIVKNILDIGEPIMREMYDTAYEQGLEDAFKTAKRVAKQNHESIEAFLLDLSTELNKLKKINP